MDYFKKCCGIVVFSTILVSPAVLADSSLGDLADVLMAPTGVLTKVVDIACYLLGAIFILVAIAQYKIHRQSPKLVPLMTPIILVILGIIALLIPYVTTLTQTGKTIQEQKAGKQNLLPLPDMTQEKKAALPLPLPERSQSSTPSGSSTKPSVTSPPPPRSAPGKSGGSGHWTDDPRYKR